MLNVVYDTNYTALIPQGGFPYFDEKILEPKETVAAPVLDAQGKPVPVKKPGFFDQFFAWIFGNPKKLKEDESAKLLQQKKVDETQKGDPLTEQIKKLIEMPDDQYNDKLLTSDLRKHIQKVERDYVTSLADYKSHMAPSYWEIKPSGTNVSGLF